MEVIRNPEQWAGGADVVADAGAHAGAHALTIGVFDGVHVGHRLVIDRVRQLAAQLNVKSALVTFDPHPAQVLRPDMAPLLLTSLDHKLDLLEQAGLDTVLVVPFTTDRAAESAEQFVHSILLGCLRAKAVVVGEDFHFGKSRLGNVELLTEMGQDRDFEVHSHPLVQRSDEPEVAEGDQTISSTAIRRYLLAGDVMTAATLLGRPHEVRGEVVTGDQRGRTIGFPTANVVVDSQFAKPGDGVYAGWSVLPDGTRWPSAINVGRRPTFYTNAEDVLIEAHLIGFDDDLYGQVACVQFVSRLRGEQKFDGIDQLTAQLEADVRAARAILDD